jgi:hypothetical protein
VHLEILQRAAEVHLRHLARAILVERAEGSLDLRAAPNQSLRDGGLVVRPSDDSVELAAAAPLPKDPIELRLPPTGSLRIRYTLAGKFCDGIDSVRVHAGSADATEDQNQAVYAPVDTDGWAMFRWLPAGVPLFAEPAGRIVSLFAAAAIPPVAVGAVRQFEVELADMAIGVRARVLDPAGAPLANASLFGSFGVDRGYGSLGVRTDAQGVFLHFLPNSRDKTTIQLQRLELAVVDRPDLRLQVPPRELQLGVNELGDLRVGGEPLVCGGRLDGYVAGQQGVQLTIERERIDASAGAGAWRVVDGLRVGVGADGVFAARGEIGAGRYRLVVTSRDYLPVFVFSCRDALYSTMACLRLTLTLDAFGVSANVCILVYSCVKVCVKLLICV